jgi:hypothetical protein
MCDVLESHVGLCCGLPKFLDGRLCSSEETDRRMASNLPTLSDVFRCFRMVQYSKSYTPVTMTELNVLNQ